MKVKTTGDEDRFVSLGAKDYYQAATAVHAFQEAVLKTLDQVTDEFDSELNGLGLSFESARDDKKLVSEPYIGRKIARKHLSAGIVIQWDEEDRGHKGKPLCVYWWIWLNNRDRREALGMHMKSAIRKPCEWEVNGTSYISLYFSMAQSARIKEHARTCTAEFVRVLNGCRKLLSDPAKPEK